MVKPIFLSKTHFFKGIGGYFTIALSHSPQLKPPNPKRPLFKEIITCLYKLFYCIYFKKCL